MDFTNFFFGGKKAEDPGYQIGQSLRFRGAQSLSRTATNVPTSGSTPTTFSFWIKRGAFDANMTVFSFFNNQYCRFYPGNNFVFNGNGAPNDVTSTFLLRDPSAWYHVVTNSDGYYGSEFQKCWINGVDVSGNFTNNGGSVAFPAFINASNDLSMFIGMLGGNTQFWDGYISDFYAIEGKCLPPTVFGNYDENGVWTPRDPGFEVNTQKLSAYLSSPDGPIGNPENAFDGNESTSTSLPNGSGNSVVTFAPATPIPYSALFAATNMPATGWEWEIGGVTTAGTATTSVLVKITDTPGEISEDRPLILRGNGAAIPFIQAMATEAGYLVDGPVYSNDLTSSTGAFSASQGAPLAFDGNTSTEARTSTGGVGTYLEYAPSTDIEFATLEVYSPSPNVAYSFNDHSTTVPASANTFVLVAENGTLSSTQTLRSTSINPSTAPNICAIRVNGSILVNGEGFEFGSNGFHLDFADPNDIGKDVSGNGNHFTATGFDLIPPGNYSTYFTGPNGWESPYFADQAFVDPNSANPNGTFARAKNNGDDVTFNPPGGISYSTGYQIKAVYCDLYVNGVLKKTLTVGDPIYYESGSGTIDTVEFKSVGGRPEINYFIIDGTGSQNPPNYPIPDSGYFLYDNAGSDYDLMDDSPTQNWATLNSLIATTSSGIARGVFNTFDGNLRAGPGGPDSNDATIVSTLASADEDVYAEVTITDVQNAIAFSFIDPNQRTGADRVDPYFFMANQSGETKMKNAGDDNPGSNLGVSPTGQTFGFHVRAADGEIDVYNAGSVIGTSTGWDFADECTFMLSCNGAANVATVYWNYGQKPYVTRPSSAGDSANLESKSLRDSIIPNGRDHFQALTGLGSGVAIYTTTATTEKTDPFDVATWNYRGTTPFSVQDGNFVIDMGGEILTTDFTYSGNSGNLYILLSVDGINWREVGSDVSTPAGTQTWADGSPFRYVRHWFQNDNNGYTLGLSSTTGEVDILSKAQSTFPYGLWWIKDRINNSNHQLLDNVRGSDAAIHSNTPQVEQAYSAPAGQAVAWCWKSGGDPVTNNEGPIESQVSANTDAGFSIITWTGTGSNGSYGHGLNKAPEMVLHKNRDSSGDWHVLHKGIIGSPAKDVLYLNLDSVHNAGNSNLFRINPDDEVIFTGDATSHNVAGNAYVDYAWHSVPGFSHIGSYTGNNNIDGPFIHCGFKPAFFMVKNCDATSNWIMYDNARDRVNVVANNLGANLSTDEDRDESWGVDFLSNGIKLRTSHSYFNASGNLYVFIAFAENPFSYPVTAR